MEHSCSPNVDFHANATTANLKGHDERTYVRSLAHTGLISDELRRSQGERFPYDFSARPQSGGTRVTGSGGADLRRVLGCL
jgi:hypothetical protein